MVYGLVDEYGTRIFAKARNLMQRGQDLREKWESFRNPKALLLDHSKFDAHCSKPLLQLEHWFYSKCNSAPILRKLLKWQLINKGYTKNGTRYTTQATRMSGDQNTGLGNSLINYALLASFCQHHKLKASIYVDGDDSVIIYEDEGTQVDIGYFRQFGMVTKSAETDVFEHVEFCQTRPVYNGTTWACVRNPLRILARSQWTVKEQWARKPKVYLASIGRCEIALGMGYPVGQYLGSKLAAFSNKHIITDLEYCANRQFMRPRAAHVVPPTDECRASYELAWGLTPDEQLTIESLTLLPPSESIAEEYPFRQ